jgi:hypothetical protein
VVIKDSKITICHATGSATNPYNLITVSVNGLNGHGSHTGDIIPAPEGGCPSGPLVICAAITTICQATGDDTNPYNKITVNVNDLAGIDNLEEDILPAPMGGCPASPVVITDGKITVCHANGTETNPFTEVTVSVNGLDGHGTHEGDIVPMPAGGCPTGPLVITDGMITVCQATGDESSPYTETSVNVNGLAGNKDLEDEIIPMPACGCPTIPVAITDGKIAVCHATSSETNPYNLIMVSVNGLNGHGSHLNDIVPAPEGGCPTGLLDITDGKITICHATSSATNPFNEITVSVNGLNGHGKHDGDIIPAPAGGCPASPVVVKDGKITICHATSSAKNPYNEITISINGLNGHAKHEGDIIPAPAGGCPSK